MTVPSEMNFAALPDRIPAERLALVELARDGTRREWSFGDVARAARHFAGELRDEGVGRGDVVVTVLGNRPEWVVSMLACFRLGAVVLPCTEQLRARDLATRISVTRPSLIIADERNRDQVVGAMPACPIVWLPDPGRFARAAVPEAEAVASSDAALLTFTSGTSGEPKPVVHAHRYLWGQRLQAKAWLAPVPGDLVWCTAGAGWSKAARNGFIAPWLAGAAALLHDGRFDPEERLAIARAEGVAVLCMAPTEYRVIARRTPLRPLPALRSAVAAGEALDPGTLATWQERAGVTIRDGYGQTETGQVTGTAPDAPARPGSMGRPLPGVAVAIDGGELVIEPGTLPTFFVRYLDAAPPSGPWHTGDRVRRDDDGYLYFEGRADDVIISSGYRIGPFEVESVLLEHEHVAEAAVVAAPDDERGAVVRAVVVVRDGCEPSAELRRELQDFVKTRTAPYKYPRIVDFAPALPRTASGKVHRAALRDRSAT